jgi:predicted ABC-type exoprotein transport system permease subunit
MITIILKYAIQFYFNIFLPYITGYKLTDFLSKIDQKTNIDLYPMQQVSLKYIQSYIITLKIDVE